MKSDSAMYEDRRESVSSSHSSKDRERSVAEIERDISFYKKELLRHVIDSTEYHHLYKSNDGSAKRGVNMTSKARRDKSVLAQEFFAKYELADASVSLTVAKIEKLAAERNLTLKRNRSQINK